MPTDPQPASSTTDTTSIATESPASSQAITQPTIDTAAIVREANSAEGLGANDPTPNAAASTAAYRSFRDVAREQYRYEFPEAVQDDESALAHLIDRARINTEADLYAQIGRRVAPRAQEIQQYLQGQGQGNQSQAAAQASQPARNAWEPPEFKTEWLSLVQRDEATGLFYNKPGAPVWAADKVNDFVDWKRQYEANPAAVIGPLVEARASEIADRRLDARFERERQRTSIEQITAGNMPWFAARDSAGNVQYQANGAPKPTPLGQAYLGYLSSIIQAGVTDPVKQDYLAKMMLRGDVPSLSPPTTPANPQPSPANYAANVNPTAALAPSQRQANPAAPPMNSTGLSLREMLTKQLREEGVNELNMFNS